MTVHFKFEYRISKQIQNCPSDSPPCGRGPGFEFSNVQNKDCRTNILLFKFWSFEFWSFECVSDFVFRISDFYAERQERRMGTAHQKGQ